MLYDLLQNFFVFRFVNDIKIKLVLYEMTECMKTLMTECICSEMKEMLDVNFKITCKLLLE